MDKKELMPEQMLVLLSKMDDAAKESDLDYVDWLDAIRATLVEYLTDCQYTHLKPDMPEFILKLQNMSDRLL